MLEPITDELQHVVSIQISINLACENAVLLRSQTAGSLFFSRNFSREYKERLFSLKENGTRHSAARLLLHSAILPCLSR